MKSACPTQAGDASGSFALNPVKENDEEPSCWLEEWGALEIQEKIYNTVDRTHM